MPTFKFSNGLTTIIVNGLTIKYKGCARSFNTLENNDQILSFDKSSQIFINDQEFNCKELRVDKNGQYYTK